MRGHGEAHREVLGLGRADHVEDQVGPETADPVPDGGQVGGGVAVALVGLLDDQRQRLARPGW